MKLISRSLFYGAAGALAGATAGVALALATTGGEK